MTRITQDLSRKTLKTDNHILNARSIQLEEDNQKHRAEEHRLISHINRIEDAVRQLCIKILSGNIRNEQDAGSWETMDVLFLIGKASTSLDTQQQRWVDLSESIMKKIKRYSEENDELRDELQKHNNTP